MHIVASPQYLSNRGIPKTTAQLADHQLIGFTGAKVLNQWPLKGFTTINPSISASSGETVRQLALASNGIACLSAFMVKEDIAAGRLIMLLKESIISKTDRELVNAVYYKSTAVSKRVSAFIDFIQPKLTLK